MNIKGGEVNDGFLEIWRDDGLGIGVWGFGHSLLAGNSDRPYSFRSLALETDKQKVAEEVRSLFNFFTKTSDPVCEMRLEKNSSNFVFSHQGKNYYFCSPSCRQQFESKPEKYVRQETSMKSGGCCCSPQALK